MALLWFFLIIVIALIITPIMKSLMKKTSLLPPSPPTLPILGNLPYLIPSSAMELTLRRLHKSLGPIITFHIPFLGPYIFIMDREVAHQAFVRNAAAFAHRPPLMSTSHALRINNHNINNCAYGPRWRLLRRNLAIDLFNPSRINSYTHAHRWAFETLVQELTAKAEAADGIVAPRECFTSAILRSHTVLCFGDELDEQVVRDIRKLQCELLSIASKLAVLGLLPKIAMVVFVNRWKKISDITDRFDHLFHPLFRARKHIKDPSFISYVDSLLNLQLNEEEMVSLCVEYLNAGTETISAALQWIMANIVKHQDIQKKLLEEIEGVMGKEEEDILQEKDVEKLPYLRAVVLEGLRMHPPSHFLLPHTVGEDVQLNGYVLPKGALVNCALADIGRDEEVWEEPLQFRPERFLAGGEGEGVDVSGGRKIMMIPFGVGRRTCPGMGLAMVQLSYFVANLIAMFQWDGIEGEEVDLEDKPGLIDEMKNPLKARLVTRR